MSHGHTSTTNWAVACWILAVLFSAFGVYCWIRDPFYTGSMAAQGLGSLFSWLAALAGLGVGIVLGLVGLLLARRFLLALGRWVVLWRGRQRTLALGGDLQGLPRADGERKGGWLQQ